MSEVVEEHVLTKGELGLMGAGTVGLKGGTIESAL